MKNNDSTPQPKNFEVKRWNPSVQSPDSASVAETKKQKPADGARGERKARMQRELRRIRQKNDQERMRRRGEKAALKRLSSPEERRAFIEARKAEAKAAADAAKAQAAERRREIAELPPEERKKLRREQKYQRKLQRKASRAYIPLQVFKYAMLTVLAAGLIYMGNVAYGIFFDNSYAFHNTGQAMAPPSAPSSSHEVSAVAGVSATADPYSLLLSQADLDFMKNRVNILVMGIDRNAERENWGSFRTDTMIFLSIDFETNNVYMISLPRDSYVRIYNHGYRSKINTAFSAGGGLDGNGFEYSMNTVSMLLGGIPVNNYVCFDMEVVMDVVDAMGGIDYDVEVPFNLDGRTMKAGFQHLDGQGVLDYCRVRHITGGSDIARTQRQRKMIMAIFSWMKDNGQLQDIPAIYSAVASNIFTDLTFEQITSLAAFALKLDPSSLHEYLLPGGYLNMEDTSFWGIDQSQKRDMIQEIFGETIRTDNDDDISTLRALVQKKDEALAAGRAAISDADSYIAENKTYITAEQQSQYDALKQTLQAAMAKKNPQNVGSTIEPITQATNALSAWLNDTKDAVEAAKATPTSTPSEPAGPTSTPDPAGPTSTPDPAGPTSTPGA